jgi:2'-5' RNA ligase
MRVFIAIDIDDKIRKAIGDLQKQLDAKVDIKRGDVKWVEPENIHLTLKFMGELDEAKLPEVRGITEQVAAAHNKFTLDIESVGSFPPLGSLTGGGRSAKVVWVGVSEWHGLGARENSRHGQDGRATGMAVPQELLALQKDLDDRLTQAGFPSEDREFSAHLTLCRVKNFKAGFKLAEACDFFKDYKLGSISADALCIYQSQLTPAGPIYTLLESYKLS